MAGIMLDSTNPDAVITAVRERREWRNMVIRAAALYVDGTFAAPAAAFTGLRSRVAVVEITVRGTVGAGSAKVKAAADVEPGDLDPAGAAQWAFEEVDRGAWPVLYVNRSNHAAVVAACEQHGLTAGKDYGLWVATLDGTFHDDAGGDLRHDPAVVAVQFATAAMLGIDADGSVLTAAGDRWLSITPSWQADALDLADQLVTLLKANQ